MVQERPPAPPDLDSDRTLGDTWQTGTSEDQWTAEGPGTHPSPGPHFQLKELPMSNNHGEKTNAGGRLMMPIPCLCFQRYRGALARHDKRPRRLPEDNTSSTHSSLAL